MKICVLTIAGLLASACAQQPFEPQAIDDIPDGPGLISGSAGEFVLYRRAQQTDN